MRRYERAYAHFQTLDTNIRDFLAENPYLPVANFDTETRQYSISFGIEREMPPDWSLLIGECLYNLRSSLDHLVWQLACDFSGDGDIKTQFPIFLNRRDYWRKNKAGAPTEGSGLRKVQLIDPKAATGIEKLQPYQRTAGPPSTHPLYLLNQLRNIDEHRLLHLTNAALGDTYFTLRDQAGRALFYSTMNSGNTGFIPFDEHTDFMSGTIQGPTVTALEVDGEFTFQVAFAPQGVAGMQPVSYVLSDILTFVSNEVFVALEPFLKT